MNLSALTSNEILRICNPETELEKRLFEICKELESESEMNESHAEQYKRELDHYECECCAKKERRALSAISLIEIGKVQDAVNILKRI